MIPPTRLRIHELPHEVAMLENRFREIESNFEDLYNRDALTESSFKYLHSLINGLTTKVNELASEQKAIISKLTSLEEQTQEIDDVVFQGTITEGKILVDLQNLGEKVSCHEEKLSEIIQGMKALKL